jgi:PAS domain S-box-containing protein
MLGANKLTMFQKGLILISVPLIFEILFVAALVFLRHQVEIETTREERSKELIRVSHMLLQQNLEACQLLMFLHLTRNHELSGKLKQTVGEISADFNNLKLLIRDNPVQQRFFHRLEPVQAELIKDIRKADQSLGVKSKFDLLEAGESKRIAAQLMLKMTTFLGAIIADEQSRFDPGGALRARNKADTWLYWGVGLNVALSLALAVFFSKQIAGRLVLLRDNAYRLSRQEPLSPLLSGSDEIAYLDRVFHETQATLAEASRKERALFENAVDAIFSFDVNDSFVKVNPAAQRSFGLEPGSWSGRSIDEVVLEDDIQRVRKFLNDVKSGAGVATLEAHFVRTDGIVIDVSWSAHWSSKDKTLFCVVHDITEQKELEKQKREFRAMIAYDLRSPLTGVLFSSELLSEGAYGELSERGRAELATIDDSVQQMLVLIDDLLQVEKLETGQLGLHLEDVDLARVLERSVRPLRSVAEFKKIKLSMPSTKALVRADEDKLVRVVLNLVSNALKFSPPESEIVISVDRCDGMVMVKISDRGPGISEQARETIFERFRQAGVDETKEQLGTGLGLAICQEIVELHAGSIGLDSTLGNGSTFWFKIPESGDQFELVPGRKSATSFSSC